MPNLNLSNTAKSVRRIKGIPGIIKDSLVLNHDYQTKSVIPISDGAVYFNGNPDYIATNSKPVDTANATYCFWAKSDETGENDGSFGHGTNKTGAFGVNHATTGKPLLYLSSTHYQYWEVTHEADDNKWHHWAVVVDVTTIANSKLYIDGALQTQSSGNEGTALSYGNLEIGRSSSTFEYKGYKCNFGVWSGHLTQPQIKSIMNKNYAGLTTSEKTNLVAWWDLDSIYQNPGDRSNNGYWDGKSILVYESGASDGAGGNTSFHEAVVSKDGDLSSDLFGGEGSFNNGDTGYFTDQSATYDSGAITFRNTGYNALQKTGILTEGKIYRFDFDVLSFDSDILKMQFNWGSMSPGAYPQIWEVAEGTGSFSITFKAPMDNSFIIYATGDGGAYKSITLDNLVIREVQNAGELL